MSFSKPPRDRTSYEYRKWEEAISKTLPGTWAAWEPVLTSSMTIANQVFVDTRWFAIGKIAFFNLYVSSMNLGGVASLTINASLPFTPVAVANCSCHIDMNPGFGQISGVAIVVAGTALVSVSRYDAAVWTLGTPRHFGVTGFCQIQ